MNKHVKRVEDSRHYFVKRRIFQFVESKLMVTIFCVKFLIKFLYIIAFCNCLNVQINRKPIHEFISFAVLTQ